MKQISSKHDGQYIYQVNKQRVIITKALPAEQMSIVATLSYADQPFTPTELFLDKTHLVVIGTSFTNIGVNASSPIKSDAKRFMPITIKSHQKPSL